MTKYRNDRLARGLAGIVARNVEQSQRKRLKSRYTCSTCGHQLFRVGHGMRSYLRCPKCGATFSG